MNTPAIDHFLCDIDDITVRMEQIDPRAYDKTRNYLNGEVTWLSPFVTHGIINTRNIADTVLENHKPKACYRLLFELGWREFFHRTWQLAGDEIFDNMYNAQRGVRSDQLPEAIRDATTGIDVVDQCLRNLTRDGLMHNHARMWVAGISCNMAGTSWQEAARWMHYHLLDGDLASNTLSWQWIAGTFSHKQYVANQANIDKYSDSVQSGSWLDVPYESFDHFEPPPHLTSRCRVEYDDTLPGSTLPPLDGDVALRSVWHLDPTWRTDIKQHIVFIDEALASEWPMSQKRWQFIKHWASRCQATIYRGSIAQLKQACTNASVCRTEYPSCNEWPGEVIDRTWLYPLPDKTFRSFSQYFKQVKHHAGL